MEYYRMKKAGIILFSLPSRKNSSFEKIIYVFQKNLPDAE
jgi:hypothetical protein